MLGLLLLVKVYGTYWKWDPKVAVTFIAWLIYSIGVAQEDSGAGRPVVWPLHRLAGFAVILFSLVVVNFFFTAFHEFV